VNMGSKSKGDVVEKNKVDFRIIFEQMQIYDKQKEELNGII